MNMSFLKNAIQGSRKAMKSQVLNTLLTMKVPGTIATVIAELVVGVVMMFVGIFMIDAVSTATALTNTSTFYGVQTALVTTTGTIFAVLGLVIIVVALATAIGSLKAMT